MLQVLGRYKGPRNQAARGKTQARRKGTGSLRVKLGDLLGQMRPSSWVSMDTGAHFLQAWDKVGVVSYQSAFETLLRGHGIRLAKKSTAPKQQTPLPTRLQKIRERLSHISVSTPNAELTPDYYGLMVEFIRECSGMELPDDDAQFPFLHHFEWWSVENGFIDESTDFGDMERMHAAVRDYLQARGAFDSPHIDTHQMSLRMFDHLGYLAIRQMYQARGYTLV